MTRDNGLTLSPIGLVVEGRRTNAGGWERDEALIEIDESWSDALEGIEEFSHIWVLWWIDRAGGLDSMRVHPEGRAEMPLVGVFATRSPRRANPVGLTAVRLLERTGRRLRVAGLDAFQGTPVLDIKPYLCRGDLIPDATSPAWLDRLWRLHDKESRAE
jgi:tRNA-Thr(GGU) m(6)t(6)A37 methyltransferase TsaA